MRKLLDLVEYTVLRPSPTDTATYDVNGNLIERDNTAGQFTIRGSTEQAITGDDLKLLPEGFKATNTKKIYTKTQLKTFDEDTGEQADILPLDDGNYEVQVVEKWKGRRLNHYKVILVREEKGNA